MIWLNSPTIAAASLPAIWLIATPQRPANLRERSLLRQGMARDIIARQIGVARGDISIGHDSRGRPRLADPADASLHLSLATRAGFVAVGLAHHPVGVDVEQVDPSATPPLALLHPREREALLALPEAGRPLAFARIWAAKEAYVKALGTGFAQPPESFAATMSGPDRFEIAALSQRRQTTGEVRLIGNGGEVTLAAAIIVLD